MSAAGELDEAGESVRLFFALWPDPATRAALAEATRYAHALYGGRATRIDTLHLTLRFLGDVAPARIAPLCAGAAGIRARAFTLAFDHMDCWRHNRIACLGASETPTPLAELVAELETLAIALGLSPQTRPYRPHITLARRATCGQENPAPQKLLWTARDFVLVRSSLRAAGARYQQLGRWPLL
jgi:2'-5' RNA ligase